MLEKIDCFEQRITCQLDSGQNPNIMKVKVKLAKIRKLVDKLYERPYFLAPVITEIELEIEIENIFSVLVGEEGEERENKKLKHKKGNVKMSKKASV